MGTLDQAQGSNVKTKIALVDVTGNTAAQIESAFNTNYGSKGWRFKQAIVISTKTYMIFEKEI